MDEKVNILLVDDTPSNLLALEVILEDPSYNLVGVTSGRAALAYLADHDVAVILTDVMMPIMDGFTLVKTIKENSRFKDVPVIFLTAMAKEGSQIYEGYTHGAVDYIQKPLSEDIVRAKVAVFVQLWLSREAVRRQALDLTLSYQLTSLQLQLTTLMSSSNSLAEGAPAILQALGEEGHAASCRLWTRCAEPDPFQLVAEWEKALPVDGAAPARPSLLAHDTRAARDEVWASAEVAVSDGPQESAFGPLVLVMCPAVVNERVVGVIELSFAKPWAYDQRQQQFFRDLSFRLGLFVQRMWAEESLLELNSNLEHRVRERTEELTAANAELHRSGERFRILSEAIPQIVWTAAADGGLDYCNQGWFEYTGLRQEGLLLAWWCPVHPEDLVMTQDKWGKAVGAGEPFEVEHRLQQADGAYRWHVTRAMPQLDGCGRAERWFGTSTDIEDTKASEQRYVSLYESAEKMNRMRDEFLAMLSHELRTPLNIIMGYADLIENEIPGSEEYEEALRAIQRNSRLQNNLISELLDVSRIITGKLVLSGETVELATVVATAVESLKLAAQAKGIQIRIQVPPRVQRILGDSSRLQQVLWNLVSNAIKFTPYGGEVVVVVREQEGQMVVEVRDSGEGIEPAFLPYVFERFKQEDSSSTRQHGGLGLGLAIVRHIVELHGGSVQVESGGKGLGATFRIFLPYTPSETPAVAHTYRIPGAAPASSLRGASVSLPCLLQGQSVLVVDDQPDARSLVARVLERAGARVYLAESSSQALRLLHDETLRLLICDIGMPGEDGYSFIGHVRSMPGHVARIPAIALTAYASQSDRKKVEEAGFQLHLAKPITPKALIEAVTQFVH